MRPLNEELVVALENVIEAQKAALLGYSILSGRQDAANWCSITMGGVKEGLQEMEDLRGDVRSKMDAVIRALDALRNVEVALDIAEKEKEEKKLQEAQKQEANTKAIAITMAGPDLAAVERSLGTMSKAIASLRGAADSSDSADSSEPVVTEPAEPAVTEPAEPAVTEPAEPAVTEPTNAKEVEKPRKIISTKKREPKKVCKYSEILEVSSDGLNPNKPEGLFLKAPIDIEEEQTDDMPLWLERAKEDAKSRRKGGPAIKSESTKLEIAKSESTKLEIATQKADKGKQQRADSSKQQTVKIASGLTLFMPPYKWDTLFDIEKEIFSIAVKCLTETPTFKRLMSTGDAPEFKPYIEVNRSYSILRISPQRSQWIFRLSGASNNRLWRSKSTIVTFNVGKKYLENATDTGLYISPVDKKPFPLSYLGESMSSIKIYDEEHMKSLSTLIEKSFITAIQRSLSPEVPTL